MARLARALLLVVCVALSVDLFATTYYIDYQTGADTNNGTSTGTPWQLAPGMHGCAANCLTKYNAGFSVGDQIILKGGVTWPNSALPFDALASVKGGSSTTAIGCTGSGCIYIGGDPAQQWYNSANCAAAGYSGWCRPILNGGGATIGCNFDGTVCNTAMRMFGGSNGYVVVNDIEITGLAQLANSNAFALISAPCTPHCEVKNMYFHGWSHGGSATSDDTFIVGGPLDGCPGDTTSSIHDSVWDGSDTTKDMAMAMKGGPAFFYNNYVIYMHNGVVGFGTYWWQNTFRHQNGDFDPNSHGNVIESVGCNTVVWNNWIDDSTGGASLFPGPIQGGPPDFYFNNLITNQLNQPIQVATNECGASCTGTGEYIFDNTIQMTPGNPNYPIDGPGDAGGLYIPFMTIVNNHLIQDSGSYINWGRTTKQTVTTNLGESNAQATSAGYTQSETFWYTPPNASAPTVGKGTNESSVICALLSNTPPASPANDCLTDTAYGVGYDNVNHIVIVPGRSTNARVQDIGAYEFVATQAPQAPTQLTAVVH
jgi:hypothetical protein